MAFRIRKKQKRGEKTKRGKETNLPDEKQELAERDAIAESSEKPRRDKALAADPFDGDEP